jgi:hypothetical protein
MSGVAMIVKRDSTDARSAELKDLESLLNPVVLQSYPKYREQFSPRTSENQ